LGIKALGEEESSDDDQGPVVHHKARVSVTTAVKRCVPVERTEASDSDSESVQ
jgi:hypothetical protein